MKSSLFILTIFSALLIAAGCIKVVAPPVINFSGNPEAVAPGGISTLQWNVFNADSVSIDNGVGQVTNSGTRVVTPTVDTTYTLTATYTGGKQTKSVTITVKTSLMSQNIDSSKPISPPTPSQDGTGISRIKPPINPQSFMKTPQAPQTSQDSQTPPTQETPVKEVLYDFVDNAPYGHWAYMASTGPYSVLPGPVVFQHPPILMWATTIMEDGSMADHAIKMMFNTNYGVQQYSVAFEPKLPGPMNANFEMRVGYGIQDGAPCDSGELAIKVDYWVNDYHNYFWAQYDGGVNLVSIPLYVPPKLVKVVIDNKYYPGFECPVYIQEMIVYK